MNPEDLIATSGVNSAELKASDTFTVNVDGGKLKELYRSFITNAVSSDTIDNIIARRSARKNAAQTLVETCDNVIVGIHESYLSKDKIKYKVLVIDQYFDLGAIFGVYGDDTDVYGARIGINSKTNTPELQVCCQYDDNTKQIIPIEAEELVDL